MFRLTFNKTSNYNNSSNDTKQIAYQLADLILGYSISWILRLHDTKIND